MHTYIHVSCILHFSVTCINMIDFRIYHRQVSIMIPQQYGCLREARRYRTLTDMLTGNREVQQVFNP